ncbi:unnamed protein product [Paramecium sonneborni]|uniref:Uncharacterized protein n=1 Tax=Paramecium sonneborni TaxID=65129 RepID=A0A8S1M450_9CILI|nr:unnamed protein product [Paramecium sonneborni]
MKDQNSSFQSKPTMVITNIYQDSNRFHLPNLNQTKSQSPNNIYFNEYFAQVKGIKAIPKKPKQMQDKKLKYRIQDIELKIKQQQMLSSRFFQQENDLQRIVKNQQFEPCYVSKKIQASKIIITKLKNDLHYSQSIPPIKSTQNQKEEKEIRKPIFFFQVSIKKNSDQRQKINKDEGCSYWKYSYQDEYEDEESIIQYVSGY